MLFQELYRSRMQDSWLERHGFYFPSGRGNENIKAGENVRPGHLVLIISLVMLWGYCGACEGTITWNIAMSSRTYPMAVHVTVKTWHFHAQPHFTADPQLLLSSAP